jgi:hypothetical protein
MVFELTTAGVLMNPRHQLAFWSTLGRMAEKASYEAPARDGAWQAYRTVVDHAAQKTEYWRAVTAAAQNRPAPRRMP